MLLIARSVRRVGPEGPAVVMASFGAYRYADERRALVDHRTRTLGASAAVGIAVATGAFGLLAVYALLRLGTR
jgi:hypothetical protein